MFRGLKKVSRYQSKDVNETILQKKWLGHVLPKTKRSELKGILRGNFCSCFLHLAAPRRCKWTTDVLEVCRVCPAGSFSPGLGAFSNKTCAQQLVSTQVHQMGGSDNKQALDPIFVLFVLKSCGTKKSVFFLGGWNHNHQKQLLSNSIRSRCSAGTWSATLGASSHSSCRACPVGTYSNLPGLVGIMPYGFCCKTFMWYYVI